MVRLATDPFSTIAIGDTVSHHDFYRKFHLGQRSQVAHEHGKSTITGHRYNLPTRLRLLRSDSLCHCIGH